MQQFRRNNIRYRSASAKALEGYYNSKAFILNEIINKKHSFSETAKEILLLLFNTHNEGLSRIETLLLDKESVSFTDVEAIVTVLKENFQFVTTTFDQNIDIFDSNFIRHWMKIHKQPLHTLYSSAAEALNKIPILAFPHITESLVAYLSATMFELYELDCLLGSNIVKRRVTTNDSFPNGVILYMDDVTMTYGKQTGTIPEMERFLYYVETLIAEDTKSLVVEIRDYSKLFEDKLGSTKASSSLIKDLKANPIVSDVSLVKKVSA